LSGESFLKKAASSGNALQAYDPGFMANAGGMEDKGLRVMFANRLDESNYIRLISNHLENEKLFFSR